ncbi:MAG: DUF1345 domain-containing protein [Acidobacteriota bacterium]|nr:DUF1345 domain-containing protein [Acidobacteriota bacterium]MDE3107019.1 DUF1345 domain-containing protein [Acidobacteriota bacterium]MDE3221899.1 DUF1345 domain-containing protein [Acidobacteriota bacterium]
MVASHGEPRWPASLALLGCVGLYAVLPNRLAVGPHWIVPVIVALPIIPLSARKHRHPNDAPWVRRVTIATIALITLANVTSVALLVHLLLVANVQQGRALIYAAVSVWLTNVITFALWFWEMDRGGPHKRAGEDPRLPDFQFPQMENPTLAPRDWRPAFVDYLYTSLANGTSFAPADAMPLTPLAKSLFAAESLISFVTIAVVAARAVNILH